MKENREIQWMSIIWSAVLILIIPIAVQMLATTGYAFYIGFQTRGDNETINKAVMAMATSPGLLAVVYLVLAAVATWRGFVLAKVPYNPQLHALIAAGLAVLFPIYLDITRGNSILLILVEIIAALGGAYLGVYLGRKKVQPES